jgi:hypothetical protein
VYQALVMAYVAVVEAIDVGGIDEVPAGIDERLDDPERLFRLRAPGDGERHGPEADGPHQ